jgi:hypothetical protein
MQTRNKIIERIKLLFNLGKSPNQNEAESAIAMAKKLIDEYKIEEKELNGIYSGLVRKDIGTFLDRNEIFLIAKIVTAHFYNHVQVFNKVNKFTGKQNKKLLVVILGKPEDIEIGVFVFERLLNIFCNLWKTKQKNTTTYERYERETYYKGIADGIEFNLDHQKNEKSPENNNALVVIKKDLELAVDQYWKNSNVLIKDKKTINKTIQMDLTTYLEGYTKGLTIDPFQKINK